MKTQLFGRDFINCNDWNNDELLTAIDVAFDLKKKFALNEPTPYLLHKTLYLG